GGLADDEVGGDAAVGPAAYAEFFGVGNSLLDGVVHHSDVVLVVLVAPVGPDGFAEVLTVAGGTAGIGEKHGVAVCGEELSEVGEFGVIGPDGPTVGAKDRRIFLSGYVVEGFVEVASDFGTVFAFELHVFRR